MLIQMRSHGVDLMGAVHRHLERRVRVSLRSSATGVGGVTLVLSDVNGPRGGTDLRCTVTLEETPGGSLRAEAVSSELMAAVGRALGRARSALGREAGRDRRARTRSKAMGRGYPAVEIGE